MYTIKMILLNDCTKYFKINIKQMWYVNKHYIQPICYIYESYGIIAQILFS